MQERGKNVNKTLSICTKPPKYAIMDNVPMKKTKIILSSLFFVGAMSFLFVSLPAPALRADDSADDLQDDIEKTEKKLKEAEQKYGILQSSYNQINSNLTSTQTAIARVTNLLNQTTQTIAQKEAEITNLDNQLTLQKKILGTLLQELYLTDATPFAEVILTKEDVASLFQNKDGLLSTQEKISSIIDEINETKGKLAEEKDSLEDVKKDHEDLLVIQNKQKQTLVAQKLDVQDDLEAQQATVAELQSKLNEMRSDLNKLLGKSYDAKSIKDAIEFASDRTGVREGFLFGMLSVESRLGASVGGCDYKQSRMSSYRLDLFKKIADDLDYDYKKLKVSCPPRSYKGTGGAMGAAQFMSDTWMGYKSVIASRTGHKTPDPWNLTDGVMAMASKLANDGGAKSGSTSITSPCTGKKISVKWEVYASMRYLGWSCYSLNNYSKTVQSLSGNYKDL
jgi:membrane-bound lytic murein transglycosylase B